MNHWTCGRCGVPWWQDVCDSPIVVPGDPIPAQGRTNRVLAPLLRRANEAEDVGLLLADERVWTWLAHDVGAEEAEFGATLYEPPRHTIYLSGVMCDAVRENAGRDDLGVLIQPATNSFRGELPKFGRYAADNGCFSQGANFDVATWQKWVMTLDPDRCLFVVAPDVFDPVRGCGDPVATWERSKELLPWIRAQGHRAALVGQDGMEDLDIDWRAFDTLFIGGSTPWKLSAAVVRLGERARAEGLWTHVGRVNSGKRLFWAHAAGFDSVDGTFLAYGPKVNGPRLIGWLDQLNASHDQPQLFST